MEYLCCGFERSFQIHIQLVYFVCRCTFFLTLIITCSVYCYSYIFVCIAVCKCVYTLCSIWYICVISISLSCYLPLICYCCALWFYFCFKCFSHCFISVYLYFCYGNFFYFYRSAFCTSCVAVFSCCHNSYEFTGLVFFYGITVTCCISYICILAVIRILFICYLPLIIRSCTKRSYICRKLRIYFCNS